MVEVRESMELDCTNCYVTLKIRVAVSRGRVCEVAQAHGWQADHINDDMPTLCPTCKQTTGQVP
jgi:DnaJ-class molecular chaperone